MGEHHMLVAYPSRAEFQALGNGFGPKQLLPYTRTWAWWPRGGVPAPKIVGPCAQ